MKKKVALVLALAACGAVISQSVTLRFSGKTLDSTYVRLSSVKITNATRNWIETLTYPDTVLMLGQSNGIAGVQNATLSMSSYPNPCSGEANVAVSVPKSGKVLFELYTLDGKKVVEKAMCLPAGGSRIQVQMQSPKLHVLVLASEQGRSALKIVNAVSSGQNAIIYRGGSEVSEKRYSNRPFETGDILAISGYTMRNGAEVESFSASQMQLVDSNHTLYFYFTPSDSIGALPGQFSVSANSQVRFSQGNLQYNNNGSHTVAGGGTAPGIWRFAAHQFDYINSVSYVSATTRDWFSFFSWGTSGWNNGNTFFMPYEHDNCTYGLPQYNDSNGYGFGPTDGVSYRFSLTGTYANADWGVYNAISNGGNRPEIWRTLSMNEWYYLLVTRTTASGLRYAKAYVNDKPGLLILPDNWDSTLFHLNNANNDAAQYMNNYISISDWQRLEIEGVVFLPATSFQFGLMETYENPFGNYWSSSTYSLVSHAYSLFFDNGHVIRTNIAYRYAGISVRLVKDVP